MIVLELRRLLIIRARIYVKEIFPKYETIMTKYEKIICKYYESIIL